MKYSLIRRKEVEGKTALKHSMLYDLIKKGEFVGPIKIGERAVAWIEYEIDAVIAARIAGKSNDEIRELVKALTENRKQMTDEILAAA